MGHKQSSLATLLPPGWEREIQKWFIEDIPSFDVAGYVVGSKPAQAQLLCKSSGMLVGGIFFEEIFKQLGCKVEWIIGEGSLMSDPVTKVAIVSGPANRLLQGERIALNLIARLSGIATRAHQCKMIAEAAGYKGIIAGSRKTTPGLRLFEKYALIVAGCDAHRFDLSSCVMLKDNHIDVAGSISDAVGIAKKIAGFTVKIEVECRRAEDAFESAAAGADIVMLDNFGSLDAKLTAIKFKERHPHVILEISGGITAENIVDYVCKDIDVISMGSLTQGCPVVDFSLKIIK